MFKNWKTAVLAGMVAASFGVLSAVPAQAASSTSFGGNGDPSGYSNAMTVESVKSVGIYGQRGVTMGKEIGKLEIRWSLGCYGNWARVVLYSQSFPSPVTIEQTIAAEGRQAGSTAFGVSIRNTTASAWTPYLRLANSQSTACANAWLSSDFGTPNIHTVRAGLCA
ncbi:hypothetical protein AL755_08785 [Arthrobacter sp. ERGS1:01]|uniref:hypothetical protein n=1 Tax=Arthrobacter sp. ERGS1:01 TaxID=1704044 RepID=UPI0006B485BB|nr:hypothetical protein [Arthrobacter sp. ERGS1:01]ALE05558.1 hypothetical protein AL755_08785 [Arthrobacter sp. ERGS1:01]